MDKINIIKLEKDDLKEAAVIIRKGFETVKERFNLTYENAKGNSAFLKDEKLISNYHKGRLMFGLYFDNSLIGFIQLEERKGNEAYIEHFTILEQYRGLGYGEMLLKYAISKAKELGLEKVTLGAMNDDTKLKEYYLKNGFKIKNTKRFKGYTYTVVFMELILKH